MLRLLFVLMALVAFFSSAGISRAEIITFDLLEQGCPTEWYHDTPHSWQTDFDLGVTFSEISHVYVDWSGEFKGSLVEIYDLNAPEPYQIPIDVGLEAKFDFMRYTSIRGGKENYPTSEDFNYLSEIRLWPFPGWQDWSDILDGIGTFSIEIRPPMFAIPEILGYSFIESGSVSLSSATLLIDGVIVPEPTSFVTIAIGAIVIIMGLMGNANKGKRA